MKFNIINYQRLVFGEINTRYLAVPACHEMHPVHTISLDLEDPLIFHSPTIREHKTLVSHAPHPLLVYAGELLVNCFPPFCTRICIGMIPMFVEGIGFFRYRLGVIGYHS